MRIVLHHLDSDPSLPPVTSLGIVSAITTTVSLCPFSLALKSQRRSLPDGVPGPQADPLGDGTVLFLRSRELLLCAEGFVALCHDSD